MRNVLALIIFISAFIGVFFHDAFIVTIFVTLFWAAGEVVVAILAYVIRWIKNL